MNAFEFFFSFYGLLLGLSVAELIGGFARAVQERSAVRFGWLTPMLAAFITLDVATFWNQAWVIFRHAPYSYALLIVGLFIASIFYIAATLVFPRDFKAWTSLDEHFWAHRRWVLLCALSANLIVIVIFLLNATATGELPGLHLGWLFWGGAGLFISLTLVAALAPGKRTVGAALAILLLYNGFTVGRSAVSLVQTGGWTMQRSIAPTPAPSARP